MKPLKRNERELLKEKEQKDAELKKLKEKFDNYSKQLERIQNKIAFTEKQKEDIDLKLISDGLPYFDIIEIDSMIDALEETKLSTFINDIKVESGEPELEPFIQFLFDTYINNTMINFKKFIELNNRMLKSTKNNELDCLIRNYLIPKFPVENNESTLDSFRDIFVLDEDFVIIYSQKNGDMIKKTWSEAIKTEQQKTLLLAFLNFITDIYFRCDFDTPITVQNEGYLRFNIFVDIFNVNSYFVENGIYNQNFIISLINSIVKYYFQDEVKNLDIHFNQYETLFDILIPLRLDMRKEFKKRS